MEDAGQVGEDIVVEKAHDEISVFLEQHILAAVAPVGVGASQMLRPVDFHDEAQVGADKVGFEKGAGAECDGQLRVQHEASPGFRKGFQPAEKESLRGAPRPVDALRIVRDGPRGDNEKRGECGVHAINAEALDARGVRLLPVALKGNQDLLRPPRRRGQRQDDFVAQSLVAGASAVEHPVAHGNVQVHVVMHTHLLFACVAAVQTPHILRYPPAPGDGKGEKERVKPRVVEALAKIRSRGQQDARRPIGNGVQPLAHFFEFALAHSAAHDDYVVDFVAQHFLENHKMRAPLGQNHRGAARRDFGEHVGDNRPVTGLVGHDFGQKGRQARPSVGFDNGGRRRESGRVDKDDVFKGIKGRGAPAIGPVADGTALQDDLRVVSVTPGDSCRKSKEMPGAVAVDNRFERRRGKRMAFVDDDLSVIVGKASGPLSA